MRRIAAVIGCTLALAAHGVNGASSVPVVEGTSQFHSDRFPSSLDQTEGEVEPVRLAVDERDDAEYATEHVGGRRLSWWSIALQLSESSCLNGGGGRVAFEGFASTPFPFRVLSSHRPCSRYYSPPALSAPFTTLPSRRSWVERRKFRGQQWRRWQWQQQWWRRRRIRLRFRI